jgi:hypothetical protein
MPISRMSQGTGTAVGDPLELEAVERVIQDSKRTTPLYVGSIKSNASNDVAPQGQDTDADKRRRSDILKVPRGLQA